MDVDDKRFMIFSPKTIDLFSMNYDDETLETKKIAIQKKME